MSFLGRREETKPWKGPYAPYDLVKELCLAVGVIALLAVLLTVLLSSPDDRSSTIAQWSHELPADFATTAAAELNETSDTAEYGPPYNHSSGSVQHFLFLHPQRWFGVSHPINTADDYVVKPLETIPGDPALRARSPNTRPRLNSRKRPGLLPTPSRSKPTRRRWKKGRRRPPRCRSTRPRAP